MKAEQFFYEHPVFNYREFVEWKAKQGTTNNNSIRIALQYYVKTGKLLHLRRGLYAIVPPNASVKNHKVDSYLIAGKVVNDSILAYHTALELHGLAYSSFEQLTFFTKHQVKTFEIGPQRYQPIILPKTLTKGKGSLFGVEIINRQGVELKITNISRTFVDVIDRIDLSGGIEEVYRSVENIASLDVDAAIKYCLMFNNARLAAKVGYFLEQRKGAFAITDKQLRLLLTNRPRVPQYLSKKLQKNCCLVRKWNLMMPQYLLNKAWEELDAKI